MKHFTLILLAVSLLALPSCKKDNLPDGVHTNDGIITGNDGRMCMTCGGLMLTFSEDPKPYTAPFLLINNEPTDLGISEFGPFPIYVNVDWKGDTTDGRQRITVTRLTRK